MRVLIYNMLNFATPTKKRKEEVKKLHQRIHKSFTIFIPFQLIGRDLDFNPVTGIDVVVEMSILIYDTLDSIIQAS